MTLLVDVGNTAIKWARMSADGELQSTQMQLHRGIEGISARLAEQWRNLPLGTPIVGCNVADAQIVAAVEQAASTVGQRAVRWVRSQSSFDGPLALTNGYRDPSQLGADRWHCLLGACSSINLQQDAKSLVVVNAGTATTVDCVDAEGDQSPRTKFVGKFIGGVIAPGVRMMLDSLALRTAGLPTANPEFSANVAEFPDNTDAAIVTGVLDAQAGLVYRIWHRFAVHMLAEPRLIVTGGHARMLSMRLSMPADIEDNLVLRGLALRAQFDAK